MAPTTDSELRLREARLEGGEQALQALKQATRDLELKAAGFEESIRRLEMRQASHLKWMIGSVVGLAAILSAVAIGMLMNEAAERRALDARIGTVVADTHDTIDRIDGALAALRQRADASERDIDTGRGATEALLQGFGALQQRIDDSNHRTDLMLGRLDENIDAIRSDFAYLVEGGGIRSSFAGRVVIELPEGAPDADATGLFMSDFRCSVVAAGGRLRGGTLGITIPRQDGTPRQWIVYSLDRQFLSALSEVIVARGGPAESADRLLRISSAESLINTFHEIDAWQALVWAEHEGRLTDFILERRPEAAD